jgi:DNA-binding GntR family transcriptional regulator
MGVAAMRARPERVAATLAEHAALLGALRAGDTAAALALVDGHIARFRALAESGGGPGPYETPVVVETHARVADGEV